MDHANCPDLGKTPAFAGEMTDRPVTFALDGRKNTEKQNPGSDAAGSVLFRNLPKGRHDFKVKCTPGTPSGSPFKRARTKSGT